MLALCVTRPCSAGLLATRLCGSREGAILFRGRAISVLAPRREQACFGTFRHQWRRASGIGRGELDTAPSVQPRATDAQTGLDLQPGDDTSLAQLAHRGGFIPKPEVYDERLKPGFRGGRALLVFFLCNAVPFGALLYYLREERSNRAQMSLIALPSSAQGVVEESLRVIRTAPTCFFLQQDDTGGANVGALHVDVHPPEGTAYLPPTAPLPMLPQLERNILTDALESPPVPGLGFVHFALSRSSKQGQSIVAGSRQASLLYHSGTREAYCSLNGQLSVLADADQRRRYWKASWAACFPAEVGQAPGVPPAAAATALGNPTSTEPVAAPPAWMHKDYMLVRLAVTHVDLHSVVGSSQRWVGRHAHRLEGREWALKHPDAQ